MAEMTQDNAIPEQMTPPSQNVKVTLLVIAIIVITAIAGGVYYVTELSNHRVEIKNSADMPVTVTATVGANNWTFEIDDGQDETVRFKTPQPAAMTVAVTYPDGSTRSVKTKEFGPNRFLKGSVRIKDDELKPSSSISE